MSGVDRLALVSKVLLDVRFLELKRENERLKLSLFWVDHSIDRLKKLMGCANERESGPRCRCRLCVRYKRYHPNILDGYDDEIEDEACKFGPWLEKVLQEHGLGFTSIDHDDDSLFCDGDREYYPRPDVNVHFISLASANVPATTWCSFIYGAKLWKAQTTQDPELLKLRTLFKTIRSAPAWVGFHTHESDSDS